MKLNLKPLRLIVLASLIVPFSLGFAQSAQTDSISPKVYSKEQIGLLSVGKVANETYSARKGDNYYKIARRFGLSTKYLMSINNTKNPYLIFKEIVIIRRFIEPSSSLNGIIINLPEKKLYHFTNGKLLKTYGIAVGQPTWQTPTGNFSILYKTKAPAWHIPVSIQKEMAARGQKVKTVVPAGPGNPLGNWWMAIASGIGIHSTNAPASIGYSVSHGCIRMKPASAAELFKTVKVKTPVKVIYQPVKIGVDDKNNIYLEAYGDMYSRNINYANTTNLLLKQSNIDSGNINWDTAYKALRTRQGIPVLISKKPYIIPIITPSVKPTALPTIKPTPTPLPSVLKPTVAPTDKPSDVNPYISPIDKPIDIIPSVRPKPTVIPSVIPTFTPTVMPTAVVPLTTATPTENVPDTTHPR